MSSFKPGVWIRRVISLLIDTGRAGDPNWRFRFRTLLALFGPGSVPMGWILFQVQNIVLQNNYDVGGISLLIATLTGAAVVIVRFQPVVGWLVWLASTGWVATTAVSQTGDPWPVTPPGVFALLIVQFGVARERRPAISIGIWGATVAIGIVISQPVRSGTAQQNLILIGLLGLAALLLGSMVRATRRARERVATEERITAEERSKRQILEERTRIARELHDVVAHHMSVITVQATTARYRIPELPDAAVAEFDSIGNQARDSLAELRRLLSVLRDENADAVRAPQPDLRQLDRLAESTQRAGIAVRLELDDVADLPETLSLTGYRIVQEALSNVVRHAPGADVRVRVAVTSGTVVITVVNGPATGDVSPGLSTGGLGLAGMRERVKPLDGRLDAGPTEDGGFSVRAELPRDEVAHAP